MCLKGKIDGHIKNYFDIVQTAQFEEKDNSIFVDEWFSKVINCLNIIKTNKNSLFFIGNGASASISAHFAADFTKNGDIPSYANIEGALLTCFSNDYSYEDAYAEILKKTMRDGDALIAISSSGASKNIVNATNFVRNNYNSSPIITFTAFNPDNPVRQSGTYNLYLNSADYSFAESGHAYYLHLLTDLFCNQKDNYSQIISQVTKAINVLNEVE